jgi:AcrR family transcriptional regulator
MQTPEGTRLQILEAAFETLRDEGFTGTTSRAVAARGGFNPALIFYYFGSMDALLLATVDWTSERRLDAYRAALANATSVEQLVAAATKLYHEDRDSGHVAVVSQMIAGSIARPELAPHMIVRMQPWLQLCEEVLENILDGSPLAVAVPTPELAYAVVTFYLGANLLTHLEPDHARTDAVFGRLEELGPLVTTLLER